MPCHACFSHVEGVFHTATGFFTRRRGFSYYEGVPRMPEGGEGGYGHEQKGRHLRRITCSRLIFTRRRLSHGQHVFHTTKAMFTRRRGYTGVGGRQGGYAGELNYWVPEEQCLFMRTFRTTRGFFTRRRIFHTTTRVFTRRMRFSHDECVFHTTDEGAFHVTKAFITRRRQFSCDEGVCPASTAVFTQ